MGVFKPLLKLKDKTIIERSIDSMFNADVNQDIVVLWHRAEEVQVLLRNKYDSSKLSFIFNNKYSEINMLASVKISIFKLNTCNPFYILPGDMPVIHPKTFLAVKEGMGKTNAMIAFPTIDGYRKHLPLVSWKCIDYIIKFKVDYFKNRI